MRLRVAAMTMAAASAVFFSNAPRAESLTDALALAYQSNPTIRAERARLRATQESRAQAWAGALPQITGSGAFNKVESTQVANFAGSPQTVEADLDTVTAAINGEQAIFTGFQNFNAIKQAGARIRAGGAQLISVEQQVLTDVATAYFDVQRNMAVYDLNKKNVDVLIRQQEMATARFEVGEITKTDVAQADARLANSRAQLTNAQGNLAISRAAFAQLVGHVPADLDPVEALPTTPDDHETAQNLARQFAPALVGAREQAEISRRQVKIARGALLPTVSLTAGYQYADEPSNFVSEDEQFAYGARATIPLFRGGLNYSRIREAKALHASAEARIREAERQVRAGVTAAWERLLAARAVIVSAEAAVEANKLALEGVTQEALVGTRTTLDVLDAERELLDSEVSLVTAHRDEQAASFDLLAAIGLLTPEAIGIAEIVADGANSLELYSD